ncbi:Hypothetical protein A7982_11533 [Minicystis rosea]|nr:Hypothetical protein A7982_01505 [Minicystis rosea]APR76819.1 Hypothetical protein A7982_02166 [Minicystis rosea]APR78640.1 Hypothetical protein A7982_03987 [Minicystis rosea]APR79081.1 Hypothetical protein A7982_04428 [Minicystis rosea]APR81306.1 Hypothetical protein A7982_06653 [Minicystis rosea]
MASAKLGDARRVRRAASMLRQAADQPAGRLTEVFCTRAELQAAYDFLETEMAPRALTTAFAEASLRAVSDASFVYVVVDGTSLSLTDVSKTKDFGSLGMRSLPTRGLKVIDALAVTADGAPVGLLDLEFWARGPKSKKGRYARRRDLETETAQWVDVVARTGKLVHQKAPSCMPWFLIDREGDNAEILRAVAKQGRFTIRANQDRLVVLVDGRRRLLRRHMRKQRIVGSYDVDIPAGPTRAARRARLDVRYADVVLDLPERATHHRTTMNVRVVWAHERRTPRGEERLDWMLLTNAEVNGFEDAKGIIHGYCFRWRGEDFHRAWKRGHCNVEDTQLHTKDRVIRWATMLAAVAARAERLKHLARTQPDAAASVALSPMEIEALRAAKTKYKARTETIPEGVPTIAQAVLWIAELGGYTGKSSGGPPGSTTIGRGLKRLMIWTEAFEHSEKLRRK